MHSTIGANAFGHPGPTPDRRISLTRPQLHTLPPHLTLSYSNLLKSGYCKQWKGKMIKIDQKPAFVAAKFKRYVESASE
jgi:hypothetical protein